MPDTLLHLWDNQPGQTLTHQTTRFRFVCTRLRPGPANPDNWDVVVLHNSVDIEQTEAEAAAAGMELDAYVDYLAETAIELADKAERKNPRKRLKF